MKLAFASLRIELFVKLTIALLFSVLFSCQSAPTILKTEVGGESKEQVILVDVRSDIERAGFKIPGSSSLNSEDFLILVDPIKKIRILDPDAEQIVERLAVRGINPSKQVQLIYSDRNKLEVKRWVWLLNELSVRKVSAIEFSEYLAKNKPLRPKPDPERVERWDFKLNSTFKSQAPNCFVRASC